MIKNVFLLTIVLCSLGVTSVFATSYTTLYPSGYNGPLGFSTNNSNEVFYGYQGHGYGFDTYYLYLGAYYKMDTVANGGACDIALNVYNGTWGGYDNVMIQCFSSIVSFNGSAYTDFYMIATTPSCATPEPSGGNYGSLTYSPTSVNQAWVFEASSCGYTCINGYTGSGCATPPPAPTPDPINGACGSAVGTYGYTATDWLGGTGALCSAGTATGTLTFPSPGTTTTYTCLGSYSGSNATCTGKRQQTPNACATPAPSGGNYGSLTYNPTGTGQTWVYSSIGTSCSYTCINGYTGSGCTTAPVSETGATTDTGFWGSLINPITNFFADFMGFLKQILNFTVRPEPYGVFFTGSTTPISLGVGAQVGCGLTTPTQSTSSTSWTGKDCTNGSQQFGGNYLSGSTWVYHWTTQNFIYGACRDTTGITSGSVDPTVMISGGSFTYLHDLEGNNITVANIITLANSWGITVNFKYDISVFGFSLNDGINSLIDILVGAVRYIVDYIVLISKNILDLISMFFYTYQGQAPSPFIKNACFYGTIQPIGDTFTETAITHTPNNGELDLLIILAYVYWIYRRVKKKYGF